MDVHICDSKLIFFYLIIGTTRKPKYFASDQKDTQDVREMNVCLEKYVKIRSYRRLYGRHRHLYAYHHLYGRFLHMISIHLCTK